MFLCCYIILAWLLFYNRVQCRDSLYNYWNWFLTRVKILYIIIRISFLLELELPIYI